MAVVVSEESGQMSVVERARIVRVPNEAQLERALTALLENPAVPGGLGRGGPAGRPRAGAGSTSPAGRGAASSPVVAPAGVRAGRGPRRSRRGGRRRGRRAQHVNAGRATRRVAGGIVHNWPLKLAAIVLAIAPLRGLRRVAGQQHLPGPIACRP